VVHLHGSDDGYQAAVSGMHEASAEGHWLLVHHAQNCSQLVSQLPSLLEDLPDRHNWKLWLSAHCDSTTLPLTVLKTCSQVVLESPLSLRASVLHCLASTAGGVLTASSRQEWIPLLHNIALLHSTVRLRHQTYKFAWAQEYHWTHAHLMVNQLLFFMKILHYISTI